MLGDASFVIENLGKPSAAIKFLDPPVQFMTMGDFNGNGRSDIFVNLYDDQWNNAYAYSFEWSGNPSTWSGPLNLPNANAVARARQMHVLDYDGDGKDELVVRQNMYGSAFQMMTNTSGLDWDLVIAES